MNTQLVTVSRTDSKGNPKPRIAFYGEWLTDIGFLPGALVQTIPVDSGVDIVLCDENIRSYRELYFRTKELNGGLTTVYHSDTESRRGPTYTTAGLYILKGGLAFGDTLIAKYGYGIIRARKVDPEKLGFENLRVVTVTHLTRDYGGGLIPKIHISGYWLDDIGFSIGAVAIAEVGGGFIELELKDDGEGYGAITRYAYERGLKVVQVAGDRHIKGSPRPRIGITGSLIARSGLTIGDTLACSYEYGRLKFQRLDFERLGFS